MRKEFNYKDEIFLIEDTGQHEARVSYGGATVTVRADGPPHSPYRRYFPDGNVGSLTHATPLEAVESACSALLSMHREWTRVPSNPRKALDDFVANL